MLITSESSVFSWLKRTLAMCCDVYDDRGRTVTRRPVWWKYSMSCRRYLRFCLCFPLGTVIVCLVWIFPFHRRVGWCVMWRWCRCFLLLLKVVPIASDVVVVCLFFLLLCTPLVNSGVIVDYCSFNLSYQWNVRPWFCTHPLLLSHWWKCVVFWPVVLFLLYSCTLYSELKILVCVIFLVQDWAARDQNKVHTVPMYHCGSVFWRHVTLLLLLTTWVVSVKPLARSMWLLIALRVCVMASICRNASSWVIVVDNVVW